MNLKKKFILRAGAISITLGSTIALVACGGSSSTTTTPPVEDTTKKTNIENINKHFATLSDLLKTKIQWATFNFDFSGTDFDNYTFNEYTQTDNGKLVYLTNYIRDKITSFNAATYSFNDFKIDVLKSGKETEYNSDPSKIDHSQYSKIQAVISDTFIDFANKKNKSSILTHFFDPFKNDTTNWNSSKDSKFYNLPTNNSLDSHERVYLKATELSDFIKIPNTKISFKDLMDVFSVTRPKYGIDSTTPTLKAVNDSFVEMKWFEDSKLLSDYNIDLLPNNDLNTIEVSIKLKTIYEDTKEIKFILNNIGVSKEFEAYLHNCYDLLMLVNTPTLLLTTKTFMTDSQTAISVWDNFCLKNVLPITNNSKIAAWQSKIGDSTKYYEFTDKEWASFTNFFGVKPTIPQGVKFYISNLAYIEDKNKTNEVDFGVILEKDNIYFGTFLAVTGFPPKV